MEFKFPVIAAQWDFNKNALSPDEVLAHSSRKVYWLCKKGHSWLMPISDRTGAKKANCPFCSGKKVLAGFNDLKTCNPILASEWNYDVNEKTPSDYTSGSNEIVSWKCKLGHSWEASINSRNRGNGCPYCAGQKVWKGFNDLESRDPILAAQWDYINNDKLPSEVTYCSSKKVWWICDFGHSWQATITNRHQGRGCPECDKRNKTSFPQEAIFYYISREYPDSINRYKEIFSSGMELDIFIPCLNIGIEYDGPYHAREGSYDREIRKYKICKENHITLLRVKNSASVRDRETCDYLINSEYNNQNYEAIDSIMAEISLIIPLKNSFNTEEDSQIIKSRFLSELSSSSFPEKYPDVASEWNYEKNIGLNPRMFSPGSGEIVWWKCEKGHEWPAAIYSRIGGGNNCPFCSNQAVLADYNSLSHLYPDIAAEWSIEGNAPLLPTQITAHSGQKYLWKCPKGHPDYLATVSSRTRGRGCPECKNEKISLALSKKVYQFDEQHNLLNTYSNLQAAADAVGVTRHAISNACTGKVKTSAGFYWSYELSSNLED